MIGKELSHFRITAVLGEGGMGAVYRAKDSRLDREVAIKVLPEAFTADPERLARFEREAKLLAALNHPNVGAIHGFEEAQGKPFLVLELVEGEDLAERLARGPIPVDEAIEIAKQIAGVPDREAVIPDRSGVDRHRRIAGAGWRPGLAPPALTWCLRRTIPAVTSCGQ